MKHMNYINQGATIYPMTWANPERVRRYNRIVKSRKLNHLYNVLGVFVMLALFLVSIMISADSSYNQSRCLGYGLDKHCNPNRINIAK